MSEATNSIILEETEITRRIVLHVYDDESKEFTSLTTYHGMIRIYTSDTWPSRIFWSLVVVTCLTLFMIHSGMMLSFYNSHPTYLKRLDGSFTPKYLPHITICKDNSFDQNKLQRYNMSKQVSLVVTRVLRQEILTAAEKVVLSDFELNYKLNSNRPFSVEEFLADSSLPCTKVLSGLTLRNRNHEPCEYAVAQQTELGMCWRLGHFPVRRATDRIEISVLNEGDDQVLFQVHSSFVPPSILAKGLYAVRGYKVVTSAIPVLETLLEHTSWGTCSREWLEENDTEDFYNLPSCQQWCFGKQYLNKCGCLPFHLKRRGSRICSLLEMDHCKPKAVPHDGCNCKVECDRQRFRLKTASYLLRAERERNSSSIQIDWATNKITFEQQMKRMHAFELLSYVAGSMGLFLGMSCVTLLEIFMYLFKTIWGAVNDSRHQGYLENLLGEKMNEFDKDHLNRSHEQIVITQTMTVPREEAEEYAKQCGFESPVIEENIGIAMDTFNRRPSVFRLPTRQIVPMSAAPPPTAGRTRSSTISSVDNFGVQRRSSVAQRRPSINPLAHSNLNPLKIAIMDSTQSAAGRRMSNYTGMSGF